MTDDGDVPTRLPLSLCSVNVPEAAPFTAVLKYVAEEVRDRLAGYVPLCCARLTLSLSPSALPCSHFR